MNTLIVGGGAAGIAAAIAAAECGERVILLERNRKPLKKLGVTGNGRGNLLNFGTPMYYGDDTFALEVLDQLPSTAIADFLESTGLTLTADEENRVYPAALLACVAVDALLARAETLGVVIHVNTRVTDVVKHEETFLVYGMESIYTDGREKANGKVKKGELIAERTVEFRADRLIVTVGGSAAPAHGTDGTGYALLCSLGHRMSILKPALCALVTEDKYIAGLAGQRVRASLRLFTKDGALLHKSCGEALFAENGVSGIAAMQLARFVEDECVVQMDLREAVFSAQDKKQDAVKWVEERIASQMKRMRVSSLSQLFLGATTPALAKAILRMAGIVNTLGFVEPNRALDTLTPQEIASIAHAITHFTLAVQGTRGFETAQVTAGGILTADFNKKTMQSKLVHGLYAAGEVLNIDGDCGGYNLMFAFASGLLAGRG